MRIHIRHECRSAEIWLSREDQRDPAVAAQLDRALAGFRQRNYFVTTFRSGDQPLEADLLSLAMQNRMILPAPGEDPPQPVN